MKTTYTSCAQFPAPAEGLPLIDERSRLEFPFGGFIADTPGYGGPQGLSCFPSEFRENIHEEERGFLVPKLKAFACHLEHYSQ